MVTPTSYDVTITINDVDVTQYVPSESMRQDDHRRQVGTFRCIVENPSGVVPARGHSVKVVANSLTGTPIIFLGNITELKESKRDNGITVEYHIEASDYKYRLQKSVLDVAELSGTDAQILSALLTNAYPDLSDLFNFSSSVTSFASGLNLAVGNKSILEALEDLSDLVGGADWSFDNIAGGTTIDFDGGLAYTSGDSGAFTATVTTGGNGGQCLVGTATNPATDDYIYVEYDYGSTVTLDSMSVDGWVDVPSTTNIQFDLRIDGGAVGNVGVFTDDSGWITKTSSDYTANINYPGLFTGQVFTIRMRVGDMSPPAGSWEIRLDNVVFNFNGGAGGTDRSQLQWDDTPPAADFDFDIDTSDEFGFDFDLTIGDFDDFNSVTIIGGNEEYGIDWTYPNQDSQTHINLETAIQDIAVYENTGSEGSPTWTALTVANAGEGELGVAGVDVIYDPVTHWLEFDSAPPNFYDAVRVTGNILRPIRVRVENIGAGEATYATTYSDENITSQEQAVNVGLAKLDQRNAARHLTFTTHNPGLKVGQALTVTDSTRGLNETLVIQRISTSWLNNIGVFTVECGTDDIGSIDEIIANNDKRSRDNQLVAGVTTVSVDFYTDDSGTLMTGDNDQQLYGTS